MSEAKYGHDFIKHEFDEAIAIQQCIVETERSLARTHPESGARRLIREMTSADERDLEQLRRLGKTYGATGKVEEVAGAMAELAKTTAEKASEAESEAYEAHAVLLSLKRKQQDSAAAMLKIARTLKQLEMRDSARTMLREAKASSQELADALAAFAARIATATS